MFTITDSAGAASEVTVCAGGVFLFFLAFCAKAALALPKVAARLKNKEML